SAMRGGAARPARASKRRSRQRGARPRAPIDRRTRTTRRSRPRPRRRGGRSCALREGVGCLPWKSPGPTRPQRSTRPAARAAVEARVWSVPDSVRARKRLRKCSLRLRAGRGVAAMMEHESLAVAARAGLDFADEQDVIARAVPRMMPAFEPRDAAVDQRRIRGAQAIADAREAIDMRPRKTAGPRALGAGGHR